MRQGGEARLGFEHFDALFVQPLARRGCVPYLGASRVRPSENRPFVFKFRNESVFDGPWSRLPAPGRKTRSGRMTLLKARTWKPLVGRLVALYSHSERSCFVEAVLGKCPRADVQEEPEAFSCRGSSSCCFCYCLGMRVQGASAYQISGGYSSASCDAFSNVFLEAFYVPVCDQALKSGRPKR